MPRLPDRCSQRVSPGALSIETPPVQQAANTAWSGPTSSGSLGQGNPPPPGRGAPLVISHGEALLGWFIILVLESHKIKTSVFLRVQPVRVMRAPTAVRPSPELLLSALRGPRCTCGRWPRVCLCNHVTFSRAAHVAAAVWTPSCFKLDESPACG